MKENIPMNLYKQRINLNLLQKEVAAGIGTSPKRYNNWELGKSFPGLGFLIKIKEFYKLKTIDELMQ